VSGPCRLTTRSRGPAGTGVDFGDRLWRRPLNFVLLGPMLSKIATVRSAAIADLPAISFVDPLIRADPDRTRLIEASLRSGECLVAVDGDDVLGYVILNYSFFGEGFVPLLVVAAANRRNGIGTMLLREAERRCTKRKLFVSANRSNLPAQWLFEKCGFVSSGRVENLDLNDDELLFFKAPGA
jgi:ribosomal protein S18 acetylase RimI-like enzyme